MKRVDLTGVICKAAFRIAHSFPEPGSAIGAAAVVAILCLALAAKFNR